MKIPLIISTRNVDLSDDMEDLIREKAEKLENFHDGIIRCRVKVDVPHRSQRSGVLYDVRIDITVPGGELVVKREPDEDLHVAVTNSFDVAQRRLKEYSEKQRGDVKLREEKPVARVSKLLHGEGYGFLVTPEGTEIYFHENALLDSKFDDLEVGTLVTYVEHLGDKGPQASSVSVVSLS
jgi:ribosomal subunit interface protein